MKIFISKVVLIAALVILCEKINYINSLTESPTTYPSQIRYLATTGKINVTNSTNSSLTLNSTVAIATKYSNTIIINTFYPLSTVTVASRNATTIAAKIINTTVSNSVFPNGATSISIATATSPTIAIKPAETTKNTSPSTSLASSAVTSITPSYSGTRTSLTSITITTATSTKASTTESTITTIRTDLTTNGSQNYCPTSANQTDTFLVKTVSDYSYSNGEFGVWQECEYCVVAFQNKNHSNSLINCALIDQNKTVVVIQNINQANTIEIDKKMNNTKRLIMETKTYYVAQIALSSGLGYISIISIISVYILIITLDIMKFLLPELKNRKIIKTKPFKDDPIAINAV